MSDAHVQKGNVADSGEMAVKGLLEVFHGSFHHTINRDLHA